MPHRNPLPVPAVLAPWIWEGGVRPRRVSIAVPFLYQTRTITRGQRLGGRAGIGRPAAKPDWMKRGSRAREVAHTGSGPSSTITNTEQEAFAKLFNLAVSEKGDQSKKGSSKEKIQSQHTSQDTKVAQKGVSGSAAKAPREIDVSKFPVALRQLAASAQARIRQDEYQSAALRLVRTLEPQLGKTSRGRLADVDPKREQEEQRIEAMLNAAKTDIHLWNVLEKGVFSAIAALRLDEERREAKYASPAERMEMKNRAKALAIIGPVYPAVLVSAIRQLRTQFPASSLPFMIIPRIKELGLSSYALGASTALYNELVKMQAELLDFRAIDELLQEMDNGGIDFDSDTVAALKDVSRLQQRVRSGKFQGVAAEVWAMESFANDLGRLEHWQGVIKTRLREADERLALQHAAHVEELAEADGESRGRAIHF